LQGKRRWEIFVTRNGKGYQGPRSEVGGQTKFEKKKAAKHLSRRPKGITIKKYSSGVWHGITETGQSKVLRWDFKN